MDKPMKNEWFVVDDPTYEVNVTFLNKGAQVNVEVLGGLMRITVDHAKDNLPDQVFKRIAFTVNMGVDGVEV